MSLSSEHERQPERAPALVRLPGPLVNWMLRVGVGMGPNTRMTVRGRKSGRPRTIPIAVVELEGRRWVVGAYGDVHWVRNLRAAGEAEIQVRGEPMAVSAKELDPAEARNFFLNLVPRYAASRLPPIGQRFLVLVFRLFGASDILSEPERAAERCPVFELWPIEPSLDRGVGAVAR